MEVPFEGAIMGRFEPDKFLTELHKLYERNKDKGTVYLTMKRSEPRTRASMAAPTPSPAAAPAAASRRAAPPARGSAR